MRGLDWSRLCFNVSRIVLSSHVYFEFEKKRGGGARPCRKFIRKSLDEKDAASKHGHTSYSSPKISGDLFTGC